MWACTAPPVRAELEVRLSSRAVGVYQSVLVTVRQTSPAPPGSGEPARMTLTMADPRDGRREQALTPVGPDRWQAWFVPQALGRHTGTVVLASGSRLEIGLIPAIDVRPSASRGFVRSLSANGRAFLCSRGALLPIGLDFAGTGSAPADWPAEFARWRAAGVNYVRMSLPGREGVESAGQEGGIAAAGSLEACLRAAEQAGLYVQLAIDLPRPGEDAGGAGLESLARRCGPFASLAAWEIDGPGRPAEEFLAAVARLRAADPGRHLVALGPGSPPGARIAADFVVRESDPQNDADPGQTPGTMSTAASPRQFAAGLAGAGLGLPLLRCGADDSAGPSLLRAIARTAAEIPWTAPARLQCPAGSGGPDPLRRSYGQSLVAWVPAETALSMRSMARTIPLEGAAARCALRVYGPDGALLEQRTLPSAAGRVSLELPASTSARILCLVPVRGPAAGPQTVPARARRQPAR